MDSGAAGVQALSVLHGPSRLPRITSGINSYWLTALAALDVERTYTPMRTEELGEIQKHMTRLVGDLRSGLEVRQLLGSGARLVPCDWGMCVYRLQTSACRGSQHGPSECRSPAADVCLVGARLTLRMIVPCRAAIPEHLSLPCALPRASPFRIVPGTNSTGIVIARMFRRVQNGSGAFNGAGVS